ncbi:MAG: ferritin-like domain-containing protein [Alphaproteobacteria bacterium]
MTAPAHAPLAKETLAARARDVLETAVASEKAALGAALGNEVVHGRLHSVGIGIPGAPARPARPPRPLLLPPRDMAKRRAGKSAAARIALLHALAHIELNAIDLAFDMVARFAGVVADTDFYADWVRVGAEEARHFTMLNARLGEFGAAYGDLPAHDGLWEAAEVTSDDVLARLAIVPLVLEARGLDVTPAMIERMARFGDSATAALLRTIYEDEIGHVAVGRKWFQRIARDRGLDARAAWQTLVEQRFRGALKPPFNREARDAAGLPEDWYADTTVPTGD